MAEPAGLDRIWRTAILPLLAEHYFGEGRDIEAEFGLAALRVRLRLVESALAATGRAEQGENPAADQL